jgi:hypothetical protein
MPRARWEPWRWLLGAVLIAIVLFVPKAEAAVPSGGRAWELVSFKEPTSGRMFAIRPMEDDDERFVFSTFGPAPGSESGPFATFLTAERGPAGWIDTPLSMPYSMNKTFLLEEIEPLFPASFSGDFQTSIWLSKAPLTPDGPPEGPDGLYRKVKGQPPEFIANTGLFVIPLFYGESTFADISSDGSRVIFGARSHLRPGDAGRTKGFSIYAWEGGNLQLVDVDNGGSLISTCGSEVPKANGMSASADLIYFTAPAVIAPSENCEEEVAKIYLRDLETDTTVQISASECTRVDCNAPQDAEFAGATRDGSVAFLTTAQQLTNDDHDSARDLYRYDVATGELTLLSGGAEEATGEVLGERNAYPSEDGSRAYFLAKGEVLPGETTTGEKLFRSDASGLHLVTEAPFALNPEIQLSGNGERVLFVTSSQLLPGDTDSEPDAYLYDAEEESLTLISTGPSGGNGPYPALVFSPLERPEAESSGDKRNYYAIDRTGERVFFGTKEQLLPEDTNTVADVYEWWNGQLGLISSGEDEYDAGFAGASRDGHSVLFVTNASLSPQDNDGGNRDFYVARIGGGFPESQEEEPGCDVKLCPLPPREPLVRPALASMSPLPHQGGRLRIIRVRSTTAGAGRSISVLAGVPHPGLVTASIWVRAHGKKKVLAAGSAGAVRSGKLRVDLRFARQSADSRIEKARLTLSEGDATVSRAVKLGVR